MTDQLPLAPQGGSHIRQKDGTLVRTEFTSAIGESGHGAAVAVAEPAPTAQPMPATPPAPSPASPAVQPSLKAS